MYIPFSIAFSEIQFGKNVIKMNLRTQLTFYIYVLQSIICNVALMKVKQIIVPH